MLTISGVLLLAWRAAGCCAALPSVQNAPLELGQKHTTLKILAMQVVREADGYQSHLVSPEFGLRRLVDETIDLVLEPVNICVRRVHQVLLDAARQAPATHSLLKHARHTLHKLADCLKPDQPLGQSCTQCRHCHPSRMYRDCLVQRCSFYVKSHRHCSRGVGLRAGMPMLQGSIKEGKPDDGQQHPGREQGASEAASL